MTKNFNLKKYTGATFIKASDLADGPRREVVKAVEVNSLGRPDLIFKSGRTLLVNVPNTNRLSEAYGDSAIDLVGVEVELSAIPVKFKDKVTGETKETDTVLLKPISPPLKFEDRTP